MSVINEMLRNLEKRGGTAHSDDMPAAIKAVSASSERAGHPRLRLILAVLAVGAGTWITLHYLHPEQYPLLPWASQDTPAAAPVTAEAAPVAVPVAPPPAENRPPPAVAPVRKAAPPSTDTRPAGETAAMTSAPPPASATATGGQPATPRVPPPAASTPASTDLKQTSPRQQADALYAQAVAHLQNGRGSQARASLEDTLNLFPAQHDARQLLASLLIEDKQYDKAETLLTDGVRQAPRTSLVMALARLKVERQEVDGAIAVLQEHEARTNSPDYAAFLAALLQRKGRHAEAVERYRHATAGNPGRGTWWAGLGMSLQAQGRKAEAREALTRAREAGGLPPALADNVERRLNELKGSSPDKPAERPAAPATTTDKPAGE